MIFEHRFVLFLTNQNTSILYNVLTRVELTDLSSWDRMYILCVEVNESLHKYSLHNAELSGLYLVLYQGLSVKVMLKLTFWAKDKNAFFKSKNTKSH